jgi:osmoprotectant transport system ATP-binding protein
MREQLDLTILLVTHDVTEALLLADRIAVMDRGRILQIDQPSQLFSDPASELVERLLDMPRRQSARVQDLIHGTVAEKTSGNVGGDE